MAPGYSVLPWPSSPGQSAAVLTARGRGGRKRGEGPRAVPSALSIEASADPSVGSNHTHSACVPTCECKRVHTCSHSPAFLRAHVGVGACSRACVFKEEQNILAGWPLPGQSGSHGGSHPQASGRAPRVLVTSEPSSPHSQEEPWTRVPCPRTSPGSQGGPGGAAPGGGQCAEGRGGSRRSPAGCRAEAAPSPVPIRPGVGPSGLTSSHAASATPGK